jgi:hypothetical protein
MSERKRMDVKTFRAMGYLQELNRRFLHLLGLALEVVQDEDTGQEKLGGIWEVEDPDGIIFDLENSDEDRKKTFLVKKKYIDNALKLGSKERQDILGFVVEPIPGDNEDGSVIDEKAILEAVMGMAEPSLDPENFENLRVALGALARNRHIDFEEDGDAVALEKED